MFPGDGFSLSGAFTIQIKGERPAASDEEKALLKCKRTIVKASAAYQDAGTDAVAKCLKAVHARKLPFATDCLTEADTRAAISKAEDKLETAIERACGGKEKDCELNDSIDPADIGFPSVCPGLVVSGCTADVGDIIDCTDIAACLACIGRQSLATHTNLLATVGHADPKSERALHRCQKAVLNGGSTYLGAVTKALAKCWDARLRGKHAKACPLDDLKTAETIIDAEDALRRKICRACFGVESGEDLCDVDPVLTFTPEAIFAAPSGASCTLVEAPSTTEDCGRDLVELARIPRCLRCVGNYAAECPSYISAPSLVVFPFECRQ
jgi:hypothetical protein